MGSVTYLHIQPHHHIWLTAEIPLETDECLNFCAFFGRHRAKINELKIKITCELTGIYIPHRHYINLNTQ